MLYLGAVCATALLHVAVLAFCRDRQLPSNALQLLSAVLATGLCLRRARRSSDAYFRGGWLQLALAFAIWTSAQGYFLGYLVERKDSPKFPSPADFLWLMFAFPMLLVTVRRRSRARWEWVNWLDTAQACTFFSVLYALVFSHPAILRVSAAYDVQSVALMLACVLRYSTTPPGPERVFFRNIGGYLVAYGVLSSIGNRLPQSTLPIRGWVDLCWSAPLLIFSILVLLTHHDAVVEPRREHKLKIGLPKHLQGLSSLGMSIMSICAAAALESHRRSAGLLVLAFALLLFAIRTTARESQLRMAHDTLQHRSLHDTLTGLGNREQLVSELEICLEEPKAPDEHVCLLFLDLDRFKMINDSLGHPFGDRLLIEVASMLRTSVRAGDLAVRLGGDEFVVLMTCVDRRTARQQAEHLVEQFRQPIIIEGRVLYVTASIGIVMGERGVSPDSLLRDADCAMYAAKKGGKNQLQTFECEMLEKATRELQLETDLRQALSCGELTSYYQPIVSLSKGTIVGFEALARWKHPLRGMVSPGDFIPIAEETGLIIELGRRALREACGQVERWNRVYGRDFTISVNVSARQFADPDLLGQIGTILEETGLSPSLLKLEITESVLLSGLQAVEAVLEGARSLGIEISLDDFGTGYSSLSYLLRLPFDVVKIDRSFVQALDQDPQRAEMVRMVVQLGRNLGKKVIAEGVERDEERRRLESMQCDLLQGFLFSKPLPAEVVEQFLEVHGEGLVGGIAGEGQTIWSLPVDRKGDGRGVGGSQRSDLQEAASVSGDLAGVGGQVCF